MYLPINRVIKMEISITCQVQKSRSYKWRHLSKNPLWHLSQWPTLSLSKATILLVLFWLSPLSLDQMEVANQTSSMLSRLHLCWRNLFQGRNILKNLCLEVRPKTSKLIKGRCKYVSTCTKAWLNSALKGLSMPQVFLSTSSMRCHLPVRSTAQK